MMKKKLYLGTVGFLFVICGFLGWGASQQVLYGNGFLFIPSFTVTASRTVTATETATMTPSQTVTQTASLTPTATLTLTVLPTADFAATEQQIWMQVTQIAKTEAFLRTPSVTPQVSDVLLQSGMKKIDPETGARLVYVRTNDVNDPISEGFWIYSSEVTWKEYARCVEVGVCPEVSSRTENDPTLPVVMLTYSNAEHYCEWEGMRLPKTEEYQLLTRGLSPDPSQDNFGQVQSGPQRGDPSFDISYLYGNVWEWTDSGELFGGSWKTSPQDVERGAIAQMEKESGAEDVGFRCILENPLNEK